LALVPAFARGTNNLAVALLKAATGIWASPHDSRAVKAGARQEASQEVSMNWITHFTAWVAGWIALAKMKRQTKIGLTTIFAGLIFLPGCWTYSVHPLSENDDQHLAYDPLLEGTWRPSDDDSGRIVISGDSKAQEYTVTFIDLQKGPNGNGNEPVIRFAARLVQLGAGRFLDAVPNGDAAGAGALPTHSVLRVFLNADSLALVPLSDSWLCGASEAEQANLGECLDGDFVLTAHTDVLQDFVKNHADDEGVFPEPSADDTWHRERKVEDFK
jgi:hypothetical protein